MIELSIKGESFELSVVVIDPLTSEVIFGLHVLTQCTVDPSHKQNIGAKHVIRLHCHNPQGQYLE